MSRTESRNRIVELLEEARIIALSLKDRELTYFIEMPIAYVVEELEKSMAIANSICTSHLAE